MKCNTPLCSYICFEFILYGSFHFRELNSRQLEALDFSESTAVTMADRESKFMRLQKSFNFVMYFLYYVKKVKLWVIIYPRFEGKKVNFVDNLYLLEDQG